MGGENSEIIEYAVGPAFKTVEDTLKGGDYEN